MRSLGMLCNSGAFHHTSKRQNTSDSLKNPYYTRDKEIEVQKTSWWKILCLGTFQCYSRVSLSLTHTSVCRGGVILALGG